MSSRVAADRIIDVLIEAGITHFFGLPGGYVIDLYEALHDKQDRITPITPRDEQTASCMAEMYGKLTGKPGVFAAQGAFAGSTGMFGLIEAYLASTPMLVLSELTDFGNFAMHGPIQSGTGNYGSFDLPSIFQQNTKFLSVAHYPLEAVLGVQLAIKHATTGRPGPCACLFRSHAVKGKIEENSLPEIHDTKRLLTDSKTCPPAPEIDRAADLLSRAKNPVIISGNGLRISRGFGQLERMAEALGAPVVTSYLGKSTIPETHPLAAGPIGYTGTPFANDTLAMADVILVAGSRLKPQETCYEHPELIDPQRQKIIHIDIDGRNASWTLPAEIVLIGDAALTLDLLLERIGAREKDFDARARIQKFQDLKRHKEFFSAPSLESEAVPILPQRLVREVQEACPEEAIVCTDAGNNRHWMNHFFQTKRTNSYFGTGGLGGVSWSLPAALTAKILYPETPAIGVCSDGGFAMQMHVLLTALQYRVAPVYVIMNNSSLGMVAQGMGERRTGTDFPDVDFAAIARSFGCFGERATRPGEARDAIREALRQDKPAVIDAVIDPNQLMKAEIYSPLAMEALQGHYRRK
ncbi:thiamine pyrophosphate-binding protein [Nitrospinota bacterium]